MFKPPSTTGKAVTERKASQIDDLLYSNRE
jgi:hypothetical protein